MRSVIVVLLFVSFFAPAMGLADETVTIEVSDQSSFLGQTFEQKEAARYFKPFSFGLRSGVNFFQGDVNQSMKRAIPLGLYFSYFYNEYIVPEIGVGIVRHEARLRNGMALLADFTKLYTGARFYPTNRLIFSFHPYVVGAVAYDFNEYAVQEASLKVGKEGVKIEGGIGLEHLLVTNHLLFGAETRFSSITTPEEFAILGNPAQNGLQMRFTANVQYLF